MKLKVRTEAEAEEESSFGTIQLEKIKLINDYSRTFGFVAVAVAAVLAWTCWDLAECRIHLRCIYYKHGQTKMLPRNFIRPPSLCRNYAFTRLSERRRGVGRQRPGRSMGQTDTHEAWQTNVPSANSDPKEALQTMLLQNKTLVVER